ncbi:MAG: hypothetical protein V3R45_02465 [Candidatus Aminicenantaceae bacterium]
MKKSNIIISVLIGIFLLFAAEGCSLFRSSEVFECSLVELRENPVSKYYDAVVRVEYMDLSQPLKSRFYITTPSRLIEMMNLTYTEDGESEDLLEVGDIFIVPLQKPDWKFFIRDENDIYCSHNFWDQLPVSDQWHPTKSEAMDVAMSIELTENDGFLKPLPKDLPVEWELAEEELPEPDYPVGTLLFDKIRGDIIREEILIQYTYLTEEEELDLDLMSPIDALFEWVEWAKDQGQVGTVEDRQVVFWDMEGMGGYGWSFRYVYIEQNMVVEVTVDADPFEWLKTEQDKAVERRTEKVFLRYGFGPIGEPEWQILIEIRLNRDGVFFKRSRQGITIEKAFKLEEWEFRDVERFLQENRFLLLESRSGPPGGIDSFITVQFVGKVHTVEMKNFNDPYFQAIAEKLKDIVLPKVDENL